MGHGNYSRQVSSQCDYREGVCLTLSMRGWIYILTYRIAYVDAPQIQAAYWVGGFQNSDTTPAITDSTVDYATGMIQFNTTTGTFTQLDAPFAPVQQGALVYLPIGEKGVLVFVGGEVPSIQNGINATLTPVSVWTAALLETPY